MDELYAVDKQYKAFQVIRENINSLKITNAHVIKADYRKALGTFKEEGIKFSLVLLDPPYGMKVNMDGSINKISDEQIDMGVLMTMAMGDQKQSFTTNTVQKFVSENCSADAAVAK